MGPLSESINTFCVTQFRCDSATMTSIPRILNLPRVHKSSVSVFFSLRSLFAFLIGIFWFLIRKVWSIWTHARSHCIGHISIHINHHKCIRCVYSRTHQNAHHYFVQFIVNVLPSASHQFQTKTDLFNKQTTLLEYHLRAQTICHIYCFKCLTHSFSSSSSFLLNSI